MRKKHFIYALLLCLSLLCGCSQTESIVPAEPSEIKTNTDTAEQNVPPETIAPANEPTMPVTEPPLITVSQTPSAHQIDVPALLQMPELPAGCEITSLTCLLNYYGFPIDKEVMAKVYLDYVTEGGINYTFFDKYVGSPWEDGYGCYSPVIVRAATEFLADQNSHLQVVNLSGSTKDELFQVIASGRPIVIWNTMDCVPVYESLVWTTPDGEDVYFCAYEHCVLLTGYNIDAQTVTVCDPLKGVVDYDMTQFFENYDNLYQQAVTIY